MHVQDFLFHPPLPVADEGERVVAVMIFHCHDGGSGLL